MRLNKTALTILFAGLCAAAIVAGLWGFAANGGAIAALTGAVIILVAAQLVLFLILSQGSQTEDQLPQMLNSINKRIAGVEKHVRKVGKNQQHVLRHLGELPEKMDQQLDQHLQPRALDTVEPPRQQEQRAALPLSRSLEQVQAPTRASTFTPELSAHVEPTPSCPEYCDNHRLSLFLEPVINTQEMTTAFYRAELAFRTELGDQTRLSDIQEQIQADGYNGVMDMKLFLALGPVIERLAARGQLLGVICPISRQSFANHDFLEELTRYLNEYPELARVLVIEISQSNLAQLSEDGMAGLAFLAQIGATFCLGGAGLESPDLTTLSSLGFRLLDLNYDENIERYKLKAFGSNGQAAKLRREASAASMSIIGSGLIRKAQKDVLNNLIDFGRGSIFSLPRRVRSDLDESQTSQSTQSSKSNANSKAA